MKTVDLEAATAPLAHYAGDVAQGPLVITRKGRPFAALVPVDEADLERLSLGTDARFLELIERSRARHNAEGGISSAEMRRRLGIKKTRRRRATRR